MAFPAIPTISAPAPVTPGAGTPVRQGFSEKPLVSAESEKPFSSVLHSISARQHEARHERSEGASHAQSDRDSGSARTATSSHDKFAESKPSVKPGRTRASEPSAKADQSVTQDRAGESDTSATVDHVVTSDQTGESKQAGELDQTEVQEVVAQTATESAGTPDATTQALLLALAMTPVVEPVPESTPETMGLAQVGNQEQAGAILSEGTADVVAALAGTAVSQSDSNEGQPATSKTILSRVSSLLSDKAASEEFGAVPGMQIADVVVPDEPFVPQEAPVARQAVPKDTVQKDQAPAPVLVSAQGPPVMPSVPSEVAPAAVPQSNAGSTNLDSLQPVREEASSAVQMRPESVSERPQSEKPSESDAPVVTVAAWQSFSEEHPSQSGSDLSDQERRDRQGESLLPASAGAAPGQASAQASFAGVAAGVADSKPAVIGQPAAPTHQAPQPAALHAAQTADWMPAEGPSHTRSVVLEVAQADLGRVNIRVAMNQDTVHTYFTSDRSEVGQFLANGQEKLQAAFQNAGLDMGQFRVDIDRQSAGRSFQHQTSQGQDQWAGAYRQGGSQGQGHEATLTSSHHRPGILNLVA